MPRKAPKEVIEHRLTLGDYERAQLVKAADAYRTDKYLENVDNVAKGLIYGVAAAGIFYAGYGLYKWFNLPSLLESLKDTAKNVDTFFRPYANSDLANQKTSMEGGAIGRVDEFIPYTYRPGNITATQAKWESEVPYIVMDINDDFDSKIRITQALLDNAKKAANSDIQFMADSAAKMIPVHEQALAAYQRRRNYCVWAVQSVVFKKWSNPKESGWTLPPNVEYGLPNGYEA